MFDINAIFNDAITAAVTEATKPLLARIEALENNPAIGTDTVLEARVKVLENSATPALAERLHERVTELENKPAVAIDEAKMVEALNSQEWFWEKVHNTINDNVTSRVMEAMDDHCSSYDHDDYDRVVNEWGSEDVSDFVKDGDVADTVEEKLRDILNNAALSISI